MKKKLWITSLLAALSISAAAGGIALANQQQDVIDTEAAEIWTGGDIQQGDCSFGSWFDVPTAEVEVKGQKVAATATVTYPDGTTVVGDKIALNQPGIYTITYRAQVGTTHCVEEKTFLVGNKGYTFQNEKSSAEYGKYTQFGANSTGLKVRMAANDTMTFSQLIDVESLTGTENIIDLFVTPNTRAAYDFSKLVIRLTDALDPSVYMQFQLRRYTAEDRAFNYGYVDVTFANQPWVGYENGVHRQNGWGTPIEFTFSAAMNKEGWTGEAVDREPDARTCKISFNPLTAEAKASNAHIANLNDPEWFETLWTGWPSGKARLTLTAEDVVSETANFCIKEIFGVDLTKETFAETDAPAIDVAMSEDEMPKGEVNREYAIPAASAYDLYSGACEAKVNVYRDYATSQPINVSVLNGKFKPTNSGWHTIEYTAKDALGNVGKEIRNVYVAEKLDDIVVTLPEDKITEAKLGDWIELTPATYTGGCGLADMVTTVTNGEETYELTEGGFRPEKTGKYIVKYTVTDYIGIVGTAQYEVNATPGTGYITLDTITLPKVFLSGCTYVLPELNAISYATGAPVKTLCDVDVVVDGQKVGTYKAGQSFVPSVTENGKIVKLVYKCGDSILEEREIPTIIAKSGEAKKPIYGENYLYGEGFHTSFKDENGKNYSQGIEVVADADAELCGWTFATQQLVNNVVLEFEGIADKTTFESLIITLIDAQNEDNAISIELKVKPNVTPIIVGDTVFESSNATLVTNKAYKVSYANGKFMYGGFSIAAEKTVNGEEFTGFSSSFAYVRVEMKNAKEGSAYKFRSMNESNISYRQLESFAPSLEILGEFGGNKALNDVLEIFPAIAHDVFAPSVSMTMTVFAPDGSVVTDNSGVKLENVATDKSYFITLSQYGKYEVAYSATEKDWVASNKLDISKAVFVVDKVAPQVAFINATQTTATVGDVLVCPDVAYRDNLTVEENMRVVKGVYNPYGKYTLFQGEENAIKCAYAGEYKFIVMVFDEFGNMTSVTHTVTVEEAQ